MYSVGSSPPHPRRGFTLLELLVVLALAGLLLTLAPPLITGLMPGVETKGAARQLVAALRHSRSHAITSAEDALLLMDLQEKQYRVSGRERVYTLPEAATVEMVTASSERQGERLAAIRFFPDGSSTGGRITLRYATDVYRVDVDWFTGRVRILD